MATTVTEYNVTIAGGTLTLSGPGIYNVSVESPPTLDEITEFAGIAANERFTLRPVSSAHYFMLRHNAGLGVNLHEGLDFQTVTALDRITLIGIGSNSVVEEYRGRFA
jgi:hypothetical protein